MNVNLRFLIYDKYNEKKKNNKPEIENVSI